MLKNRPFPHSESVVLAAATAKVVTVKGPTHAGLLAVLYLALAHDEAKLNAATVQDLKVKIIPEHNTDRHGGDKYHAFYGQPTAGSNNRQCIWLGWALPPGEDVDLTFYSTAGETFQVNLQRWLVFDWKGPMPQLMAPGGLPVQLARG